MSATDTPIRLVTDDVRQHRSRRMAKRRCTTLGPHPSEGDMGVLVRGDVDEVYAQRCAAVWVRYDVGADDVAREVAHTKPLIGWWRFVPEPDEFEDRMIPVLHSAPGPAPGAFRGAVILR